MLDDVRERLLDEPVEHGLDLGRKPLVSEARIERRNDLAPLLERRGEALERRRQAEVVECRRPKLDRQAAHVLQRLHDELAQGGLGALGVLVAVGPANRLQPEEDRGQRLPRLVVQLAREPPPLELLRLDHAPHHVPFDTLREVDRDRGACGKDLGEPQVAVGEAWLGTELVVHGDDPDRPAACDERHEQPGADSHPSRLILVDLRVVEDGVDARALAPLEHAAALGALAREQVAEQP